MKKLKHLSTIVRKMLALGYHCHAECEGEGLESTVTGANANDTANLVDVADFIFTKNNSRQWMMVIPSNAGTSYEGQELEWCGDYTANGPLNHIIEELFYGDESTQP